MAKATFIQQGFAIDFRPNADFEAGTVVAFNDIVGVVVQAIKANQLGSLAVEGVFEFPKSSGIAIVQGQNVYWDPNDNLVENWNSSGLHFYLGKATWNALAGTTKVRVRLSQ